MVYEDTSRIVLKAIRDGHSAGNRASLGNFLHHSFFTTDLPVLVYPIHLIAIRDEALVLVRTTVHALYYCRAVCPIVMTACPVYGACLICYIVLIHPLEGVECLPPVASVIPTAGYQYLWGNIYVRPLGTPGDLDPVRESGGGRLGPARPAVLGVMLVLHVGEVVGPIDIIPYQLGWQEGEGNKGGVDVIHVGTLRYLPAWRVICPAAHNTARSK